MFGRFYGIITKARNSLYERGVFKSFSLGVFTISVGNITVGGTGKTPLVALVAEILAETGEKVGVLSRGYGRENPQTRVLVSDGEKIFASAKQAGDEPFELAQKLLGKAIVVADANRVAAGDWARERFGVTAFVLDDAFQHRRVERDINLVTIDATNPFGNEKLLPAGILRESLEGLRRADAFIVTRANLAKNVSALIAEIKQFNSDCPIFVSENKISQIINLEYFFQAEKKVFAGSDDKTNDQLQMQSDEKKLNDKRCLAFCALGNPHNFFEQLRRDGFDLAAVAEFPDHHFYTARDVSKLEAKARKTGAEFLLTTAKDAAKLKDLKFNLPCYVVESAMFFAGGNDFRDWLISKIRASE